MSDYHPIDQPPRSITERHTRRSVAIIEPTTHALHSDDAAREKNPRHTKSGSLQSVLPLRLTEALEKDPAFRVLTRDGSCWVDPVLGTAVLLEDQDMGKVAKDWLLHHLDQWREHGTMELHELIERR